MNKERIDIRRTTHEKREQVSLDPTTYLKEKDKEAIMQLCNINHIFGDLYSEPYLEAATATLAAMQVLDPEWEKSIDSAKVREDMQKATKRILEEWSKNGVVDSETAAKLKLPTNWRHQLAFFKHFDDIDNEGYLTTASSAAWTVLVTRVENALRLFRETLIIGSDPIATSTGIELLHFLKNFWRTTHSEQFRDDAEADGPLRRRLIDYCQVITEYINQDVTKVGWAGVQQALQVKECLPELFEEFIRPSAAWQSFITRLPSNIESEIDLAAKEKTHTHLQNLANLKKLMQDEVFERPVQQHDLPQTRAY